MNKPVSGSDYCSEHKCMNRDCDREASSSYSYCDECIDTIFN